VTRHSRGGQKEGRKGGEKSNHHPAHGTKLQFPVAASSTRTAQGDFWTQSASLWQPLGRTDIDWITAKGQDTRRGGSRNRVLAGAGWR